MGTLTQADGWLACPAAICFAGAVLRAPLEGEALLAGVDECITHGGQVQRPDVGMGWCLWLSAVVGWTRGKTFWTWGE